MMPIKIMLADDHPIIRAGLRSVVEKRSENIEIVGEASNGVDLLKLAKKNPADIYIVDITMPELNGIETTVRLLKLNPKSRVIILSIHESGIIIEKAFRSGARGYILKESAVEDIIRAIREVHSGRYYISPAISNFIMNGYLDRISINTKYENVSNLTSRETEILQLIGEGATVKEIAKKLNLSVYTITTHKRNIMHKLDIHKSADLLRMAIKEGIAKI